MNTKQSITIPVKTTNDVDITRCGRASQSTETLKAGDHAAVIMSPTCERKWLSVNHKLYRLPLVDSLVIATPIAEELRRRIAAHLERMKKEDG